MTANAGSNASEERAFADRWRSIATDEGAIAIADLILPVIPEWLNPVSIDFPDEKRDDAAIVKRAAGGLYLLIRGA